MHKLEVLKGLCSNIGKRAADVVVAFLSLLFLFPVLLVIAVAIKLHDGGPILYRQLRVGKSGKNFQYYKFRSIRLDANQVLETILHLSHTEGVALKVKDDPRRTKLGLVMRKYFIDDLPQLYSVLVGDMSIIGPRPQLPVETETCSAQDCQKISVKPGLICLQKQT